MTKTSPTDLRTNDKKFAEVYKAIFVDAGKYHQKKQIGNLQIPENSLNEILELTSLLSEFSGYDD